MEQVEAVDRRRRGAGRAPRSAARRGFEDRRVLRLVAVARSRGSRRGSRSGRAGRGCRAPAPRGARRSVADARPRCRGGWGPPPSSRRAPGRRPRSRAAAGGAAARAPRPAAARGRSRARSRAAARAGRPATWSAGAAPCARAASTAAGDGAAASDERERAEVGGGGVPEHGAPHALRAGRGAKPTRCSSAGRPLPIRW